MAFVQRVPPSRRPVRFQVFSLSLSISSWQRHHFVDHRIASSLDTTFSHRHTSTMFAFQTVSCLHNIPGNEVTPSFASSSLLLVVVRSSTNKIQDVYAKAKDSSILIRLPCQLAETVADTSMKIALTVADPLVKPFRGPGKGSLVDRQ